MVKIVILFLIALALLALFGRLRIGGVPKRRLGAGKCPACGRYRIGPGPCPCGGTKR